MHQWGIAPANTVGRKGAITGTKVCGGYGYRASTTNAEWGIVANKLETRPTSLSIVEKCSA